MIGYFVNNFCYDSRGRMISPSEGQDHVESDK